MTRPTEAEVEKALRYHAAKLLKAGDCQCETCLREALLAMYIVEVLGWVLGRPVDSGLRLSAGVPPSFAGHLLDLYGREDYARLTHDPRMGRILLAGDEGRG